MFEKLITEGRNPNTLDIDKLDTLSMLKKINDEDKKVPFAIEKELPKIAEVVDKTAERLKKGGRLIYIGAGTSGRLGILDASECPPTFGTDPEMVQGIIAGGERAIIMSVEGAEDDENLGKKDLIKKGLNNKDVVVGIAASGRTPYVIKALEYAREIGAYTVGITCNPDCVMKEVVDTLISPVVGAEVIMGSTRMKAGTAQKLILNMISTGTMIKLGKVYSNLMVDVKASNIKLIDRAKRILKLATNADDELINETLESTNYNVKLSILIILTKMDKDSASKLLDESEGYIAKAIEKVKS
ncbi:N-acetylmuramic acid 6-phosphate etherase [Caloramator sp. E03]|uniref:N-acetylmuramic acid 6-phosphate etherase n=1 Tax=Caloramator sp. E03 TaxID=2576307 RepID=UPI001110D254|nr:N-acetylmuramic acid 6-phosphate etherase [Caloramator sp. E03]QCX34324.1 N-acetylmuramic acid 6-phosphate etherase [Caloramator sp. E03]